MRQVSRLLLLIVLAGLHSVGCAPERHSEAHKRPVAVHIDYEDYGIHDIELLSSEELVELLTYRDPRSDFALEELLIRPPDPAALQKLLSLNDVEDLHPFLAVRVNGLLFVYGDDRDRRARVLLSILRGDDARVAREAARFLAYLDSDQEQEYVKAICDLAGESSALRKRAIPILAHYPGFPCATDIIMQSLGAPELDVKIAATDALGVAALTDPDYRCRAQLVDPLIALLQSEVPELRSRACYALEHHGDCGDVASALWSPYREDETCQPRLAALQTLSRISPSEETASVLLAELEHPSCELSEQFLIQCLGDLGPRAQAALPKLRQFLDVRYVEQGLVWPAFQAITKIEGEEPDLPEGLELYVDGEQVGRGSER